MYSERVLSSKESLFVSRAQQKIADLGASIAEELQRNDVTFEDVQLSIELQNAVRSIQSTTLDWSADEIEMVIDFYTVYAKLADYAFLSVSFDPGISVGAEVWATVAQVNRVEQESRDRDAALEAELQAEIDRVEQESIDRDDTIIASITAPKTDKTVTSEIQQGGVEIGDVYPAGTNMTDLIAKMLKEEAGVSNLAFSGHYPMIEVGDTLFVSQLTWTVQGTPVSLKLSDTDSVLVNQAVSGNNYIPPSLLSYVTASNKDITWTLSGDNIDPVTLVTKIRYKSYYGKKTVTSDAPITVTQSDILASDAVPGYNKLIETNESISFQADTLNNQMAWIAVPKNQTGGNYATWYVDTLNAGKISVDQFILTPVDVAVNGVTYSVYRWRYRSPLSEEITLSK